MLHAPAPEDPLPQTLLPPSIPATAVDAAFLTQLAHTDRAPEHKADAPGGHIVTVADRQLLIKTAAIAYAEPHLGFYATHHFANEIACMGALPQWFLPTLLLPESAVTAELVAHIHAQIESECAKLGIACCGAHTETTPTVKQPMLVGTMLGEALVARQQLPAAIQAGDHMLLTKGLAIEATSRLGREKAATLAEVFEADFAKQCERQLYEPGLSVLPEARLAWSLPGIHAIRGLAAGGLAQALAPLLSAENLGVEILSEEIPLLPETKLLCEHFQLDPLGLLASGALLVIGEAAACALLLEQYHAANIRAAHIGRVLPAGEQRWLCEEGERQLLPHFTRDEIARVL